jgi:hypothetical protein
MLRKDLPDFRAMLGDAVLECWGALPQDIQRMIFKSALGEAGDDELFVSSLRSTFTSPAD